MKFVKTLIVLWVCSFGLYAQSDLTLYNFNAIPQSLHTNPAYPQQTKVWVGLPVLSGFHYHYHNDGFSLKDLIPSDAEGITNKELEAFASSLDDKSQIANYFSTELLGIGFKSGNGFVSLGAYQSVDFRMEYPVDLLLYVTDNSYATKGIDMDNFNAETLVRTNFYLGYQYKLLDDKLSVGMRLKYIIGQENSYVERSKIKIDPADTFSLKAETDILIKSAGLNNLMGDDPFGDDPLKAILPGNSGFGFDIGADYKINDDFSVNFSVLDIGAINWKENTYDLVAKGDYLFEGALVDLADSDADDPFGQVQDSLESLFDFEEIENSGYKRKLPSQFYLGANYKLTEKHSFGVLYHARFWDGKAYSDYSANYQGRWIRGVQFTASYSIINGTYNNVGAGLSLKLGPLQLYMLSDNILGVMQYENLQTTNLRAGLNITLYGKKDKAPKEIKVDPTTDTEETPASGEEMETPAEEENTNGEVEEEAPQQEEDPTMERNEINE